MNGISEEHYEHIKGIRRDSLHLCMLPPWKGKWKRETVYHKDGSGRVLGYFMSNTGPPNSPVLLYFHGGAYHFGSAKEFSSFYSGFANRVGCRIFLVEYALCPEERFPRNVQDCVAAYRWLLEELEIPSQKIIAFGDSAGGGLAALFLNAISGPSTEHPENPEHSYYTCDTPLPMPKAAILCCPQLDLTMSTPSLDYNNGKDTFLNHRITYHWPFIYQHFTKPGTAKTASPYFLNPKGWCSVLMQTCEFDRLLDEARAFHKKLLENGVDSTLKFYEELAHCALVVSNDPRKRKTATHYQRDRMDFIKNTFASNADEELRQAKSKL